ncbi:MAG: NRDE family protein [Acidobacteria bacterium]|nr:NRDE family protein [Acidobacteriota bacterium]MBI3421545.1 NRDE family protein [Acidobacteriota bacterium]
MCTVSWTHTATGYELFCNRDERRTRPPAWTPRVRERHGVRFSAPIDGESGGTWIGINQYGLTLALLNRYDVQAGPPRDEYLSRGWLLLELLDSLGPQHAQERLQARRLTAFQPFTLAAVAVQATARLFQWDGCQLTVEDNAEAHLPLTSSSFATARVIAERRAQFAQSVSSAAERGVALAAYHQSHTPAPGAFSVCMHRDNAQTVSYSHIQVAAQQITFNYFPQAPCAAAGAAPYATRLELTLA